MRWNKISDAVIRRLPLYLRVLDELANEQDVTLISSQELGVKAGWARPWCARIWPGLASLVSKVWGMRSAFYATN